MKKTVLIIIIAFDVILFGLLLFALIPQRAETETSTDSYLVKELNNEEVGDIKEKPNGEEVEYIKDKPNDEDTEAVIEEIKSPLPTLKEDEYAEIFDTLARFAEVVIKNERDIFLSEKEIEDLLKEPNCLDEIKPIISETGVFTIQAAQRHPYTVGEVHFDYFTNEEFAVHILLDGHDSNAYIHEYAIYREKENGEEENENSIGRIPVIRLEAGEVDFINKYNFTADEEKEIRDIAEEIRLEGARLNDRHLVKDSIHPYYPRRVLIVDGNNFILIEGRKILDDNGITTSSVDRHYAPGLFFRREDGAYRLKCVFRF